MMTLFLLETPMLSFYKKYPKINNCKITPHLNYEIKPVEFPYIYLIPSVPYRGACLQRKYLADKQGGKSNLRNTSLPNQ